MKITIAGIGYVGLSNSVLLAQHNEVVAIDLVPAKVALTNARQSPIENSELQDYLSHKQLNIKATLDKATAYSGADFVVIATPTNYDPHTTSVGATRIEDMLDYDLAIDPHLQLKLFLKRNILR